MSEGFPDHAAQRLEIIGVPGLPEFRPGDDLTAALAERMTWLRDGDVVVVTSKVFSKVEGRLVPAPADEEERDALRRRLVDQETERVVARKGRTLIVAGKLGIVQAAAGIDGSNVRRDELALLPADPDASAARLRDELRGLRGVEVAVVVTDTLGDGQTFNALATPTLRVTEAGVTKAIPLAGFFTVTGKDAAGRSTVAFDVSAAVPPDSWYGTLLKGIFNFSPRTTVLEAVVWTLYVVVVLALFLRPARRPTRRAPTP